MKKEEFEKLFDEAMRKLGITVKRIPPRKESEDTLKVQYIMVKSPPSQPTSPSESSTMPENSSQAGYIFADFEDLRAVACPCGEARRAFGDDGAPASMHVVDISIEAKTHYHKKQTEIYYFLECDEDARMELDSEEFPVKPGMAVLIKPLTRHRAVGKMRILNVVVPPFDPEDEWFD